ncbi:MAG: hypothetical protein J7L23_03305 [Candidatus Diapherotrites archaeon]|nr:hypothetical protein [Candidatus Diapherotrites archaeon]
MTALLERIVINLFGSLDEFLGVPPELTLLFLLAKLAIIGALLFAVYRYFTKNKLVLALAAAVMAYILFL